MRDQLLYSCERLVSALTLQPGFEARRTDPKHIRFAHPHVSIVLAFNICSIRAFRMYTML